MNAIQIAQIEYDRRVPPSVSESAQAEARSEWLYNAAEQLVRFGQDVKFQCRRRNPQGVTQQQLALAVDEHANGRLADSKVETPALGWLLLCTQRGQQDKNSKAELLGHSTHPLGMIGEIAEALLEPLADDALIAQAEDDEL